MNESFQTWKKNQITVIAIAANNPHQQNTQGLELQQMLPFDGGLHHVHRSNEGDPFTSAFKKQTNRGIYKVTSTKLAHGLYAPFKLLDNFPNQDNFQHKETIMDHIW